MAREGQASRAASSPRNRPRADLRKRVAAVPTQAGPGGAGRRLT